MKHIGLFEGIGGFSLAARWMGWETIAWCEWNPFGQTVLKHYLPKAKAHGDITKTDFTIYRGQCDILTGGFPCQPYSHAGKRLGKEDDRHLWPEMLRAIREISPRWVVGENVSGLLSWNGGMVFNEVQADLEAEGYEVLPFLLPACAVNAPHRRDRIWFIAYATGRRINGEHGNDTGTKGENGMRHDEFNSSSAGPITNPASDRRERNGQGVEIEKGLQQGSESARQLERGFEGLCNAGIATDTERIGQPRPGKIIRSIQSKENGDRQANRINGINEGSRIPGDWSQFPTQPPVRGRNDGVPGRLAGITVSKHRNESIKAYGNAIVPQVALQIFKAIELFENEMNQ